MARVSRPTLATLAALSAGCVIGRPARQSLSESAQGPSAAPVTGSPVIPNSAPGDGDGTPPGQGKPGMLWVRGYWHWDGARYLWERGRWEQMSAGSPNK